MSTAIDIAGRRFGRLVAVSPVSGSKGTRRTWLCECDCGKTKSALTSDLLKGKTRSCGCLARELLRKARTTHGQSASPEYRCYKGMLNRCYNPNTREYPNYGGRDIRVCERWLEDFTNFLADMGPRPSPKHSIDRIDVNGNYEPTNCRWADQYQQQNNRRDNRLISHEGKVYTLSQLARMAVVDRPTLAKRLDRGWTVQAAISMPADPISPGLTPHVHDGSRTCPCCKTTKPLTEFGRDAHRRSGVATYCRVCISARNKAAPRRASRPIIRKSERLPS